MMLVKSNLSSKPILCGITIGRYAFIGAGAVVLKDVPDYALVVGNPGKQKGWMCGCGVQISFETEEANCEVCDRRYGRVDQDSIEPVT